MAREMKPDDVIEIINNTLNILAPIVCSYDGTIGEFTSDKILAIFGSPESDSRQRENAVRAAIEMQTALTRLNEVRQQRGAPCCDFGFGIHCGEAVHGFFGTEDCVRFTVVGDAVDRAERYCAGAPDREVLISPEMREHVQRFVETERATIQTRHEGELVAYRVKGFTENAALGASGSPN
jgi:adenylate cyclase